MDTKVAVITGGTGYLGTAVTKELVARGWKVAALSRSSVEFPCDVTDAVSVNATVEKVVGTLGPITAAIHAASARIERVPEADATEAASTEQESVALAGAQNLFEAVFPHMRAGGIFIAITSDATRSGGDLNMGGYVAAKKEMEAFVRRLHAPFRTELYSAGFLPGGLNADLPQQVRDFFGAKSKPIEEVANEIADLCEGFEKTA